MIIDKVKVSAKQTAWRAPLNINQQTKASTQKEKIKHLRPQLQAPTKEIVKCKGGQQKPQIAVQEP